MTQIQGQIALITGGGPGIGLVMGEMRLRKAADISSTSPRH